MIPFDQTICDFFNKRRDVKQQETNNNYKEKKISVREK